MGEEERAGGGDDIGSQLALLRRLVDKLPAMIAYWDVDQRCRFANRAYETWFGVSPEALIGQELKSLLGVLYLPNLPHINGALLGEAQEFEREIPDPSGGPPRYAQAHYVPDIVDGAVRGFCVLVADVTRRKEAEAALRRAQERINAAEQLAAEQARRDAETQRLRLMLEWAPTGMILVDRRGTILLSNARMENLFGYARDELVGKTIEMLVPGHLRDLHKQHRTEFSGDPRPRAMGVECELYGLRRDGTLVPVEIGLSPLETPEGDVVLASVVDISERNSAEKERADLYDRLQAMNRDLEEGVRSRTAALSQMLEEREALLREKTSLLQEVHHRVKNNLQLISSLLNLQASQIQDLAARDTFLDAQGRVRSIALLHESLYQSDDLGRVDMREYVDKLVSTLGRTHGEALSHIVSEVDRVFLSVDMAVPCGLIVNELVTNALKHAFRGNRDTARNEIRIEMRRMNDHVTISVVDNGRGYPNAVDPMKDESMGLTLVRDLSLQLRGHVAFATENGARCTIVFSTHKRGESRS